MSFIKNIAIIPARGGSKRIPRKNIKEFWGKPIIEYSISAALSSNLFDEVMVSTDDAEIAEISKSLGANVPFFRSKKNSGDFSSTFDVIEEVINYYTKNKNKIHNICCIYPCAPFINSNKICEAYNVFIIEKLDSIFPVIPINFSHERSLEINENKIRFIYPEFRDTRSQDLNKIYNDAGEFYWMNKDSIMSEKTIITNNSGVIVLSELESQDINTEIDWKLAEIKYKYMQDQF